MNYYVHFNSQEHSRIAARLSGMCPHITSQQLGVNVTLQYMKIEISEAPEKLRTLYLNESQVLSEILECAEANMPFIVLPVNVYLMSLVFGPERFVEIFGNDQNTYTAQCFTLKRDFDNIRLFGLDDLPLDYRVLYNEVWIALEHLRYEANEYRSSFLVSNYVSSTVSQYEQFVLASRLLWNRMFEHVANVLEEPNEEPECDDPFEIHESSEAKLDNHPIGRAIVLEYPYDTPDVMCATEDGEEMTEKEAWELGYRPNIEGNWIRRDFFTVYSGELEAARYERIKYPFTYGWHQGSRCSRRLVFSGEAPKNPSAHRVFVGFEVEKEDKALLFREKASEIWERFCWSKEFDGSLDVDSGYELVSPIYSLYSDTIFEDIYSRGLQELINGNVSHRCGGHIHISVSGMSGKSLFNAMKAWIPFFYAIYPKRIGEYYCKAKKMQDMVGSDDKYQGVRVMGDRIELRMPSAVQHVEQLTWRISLLRVIMENLNITPLDVMFDMTHKTELRKLLRKVYTLIEIKERVQIYKLLADIMSENSYTSNEDMEKVIKLLDDNGKEVVRSIFKGEHEEPSSAQDYVETIVSRHRARRQSEISTFLSSDATTQFISISVRPPDDIDLPLFTSIQPPPPTLLTQDDISEITF